MDALMTSIEWNHWTWFVTALVLFALEFLAPGVVFMWMGIAAILNGAVVWLLPDLAWETQFVWYTIFSIVMIFVGRRFVGKHKSESEDNTLNQRSAQYVGHTYQVVEAIEDGHGRIKVGDSTWRAEGPDAAVGSKVRVVAAKGTNLIVEPE